MFSKFDKQIHVDETTTYEPTAADWEEYHEWLHEVEASMPLPEPEEKFQLSAPEGWDKIEGDDSIGEPSTFDGDESIEIDLVDDYGQEDVYPQEPWEDDYSDCDDEYYADYDLMGDFYEYD